jgi:ribosome maturation factor RimP
VKAGNSADTPDGALGRVREMAERAARTFGLDVFDMQFRREAGGWVLRVIIDRPAGPEPHPARPGEPADSISVAECARLSRDLSALLDVEDPLDRAYTLEVSSPGLDRPLRHEADYRRFTGRLAKIVVAPPIDGQGHFSGRIQDVESGHVVLSGAGGKVRRIPIEAITRARLEVEF